MLITGAGPIGLLAALIGKQRGFDVHVYDRNNDGPKPELVRALGGTYHSGELDALAKLAPDVVIECTGAPAVISALLSHVAPDSVICLAGVGASHRADFDMGSFNRSMVLNNGTVFGTVNANRGHYAMAADVLAKADRAWLSRLITRRVPLARFAEAFEHRKGDIKVVIDFTPEKWKPVRKNAKHLPHRGLRPDRRLRERRAGRRATARSTGCAGRASIPMPASPRCSARASTAASRSRRATTLPASRGAIVPAR